MVDLLFNIFNIGVSVSYSEVLNCERSVTFHESTKEDNGYIQFIFDNADYNAHTTVKHNTFHAMSGIICVTPRCSLQAEEPVPRVNDTAENVCKFGLFESQTYSSSSASGYSTIIAEDMASNVLELKPQSAVHDRTFNLFWLSRTRGLKALQASLVGVVVWNCYYMLPRITKLQH